MKTNCKKYGLLIIAAVLLVGVVFAGAASAAGNPAKIVGGDEYETVEYAFSNATDGDTVQLLAASMLVVDKIEIKVNVTLDLNGSTLTEKANNYFFWVDDGATFTLMDSSNEKTGKLQGNGQYVGGTAGVHLQYGTFIMENGSIVDLRSSQGGAVTATVGTKFIMNGGSIVNCTGTDGGAVYVGGTFNMTGGSIVNCNASGNGGGVYVDSSMGMSKFRVSGSATITGNTNTTGAANNVYLSDNNRLNLVGDFTGSIGIVNVSEAAPVLNVQFGTASNSYTGAENFFADTDENLIGTISGTTLIWAEKPKTYVEVNTWAQLNQSVAEWTDTETARIVAVKTDISDRVLGNNTEGIDVAGNIILTTTDGDHLITGKTWGRLFNVTTGNLTIIGNVSTGAVLNLTGGMMQDGSYGGAIYVCDKGNLTLGSYAKITNSAAIATLLGACGGAVYNNGTFAMNNGSISGCTAKDAGGAVENYGIFIMNDGNITGCSTKYGGAVYNNGMFTMNGGSITDCSATDTGGAVYNNGMFAMTGGSITDCSATEYGGGVVNSDLFTMTGGSIASCSAPIGSGVDQYGTFNVTGSATISSDNEVALYADEADYYNIIVDADSSFTGSIQNIKLYRYDDDEIVDAAAWLQQVVVENGAGLANKFQLSSDHSGYQLTASGSDLILTKKAKPSSGSSKDMGSTVILTTTQNPTPVPTATPAATAVPTIATVKPTSQQTSKSPAPVFGLIAGLGAAAVLLRSRK